MRLLKTCENRAPPSTIKLRDRLLHRHCSMLAHFLIVVQNLFQAFLLEYTSGCTSLEFSARRWLHVDITLLSQAGCVGARFQGRGSWGAVLIRHNDGYPLGIGTQRRSCHALGLALEGAEGAN